MHCVPSKRTNVNIWSHYCAAERAHITRRTEAAETGERRHGANGSVSGDTTRGNVSICMRQRARTPPNSANVNSTGDGHQLKHLPNLCLHATFSYNDDMVRSFVHTLPRLISHVICGRGIRASRRCRWDERTWD